MNSKQCMEKLLSQVQLHIFVRQHIFMEIYLYFYFSLTSQCEGHAPESSGGGGGGCISLLRGAIQVILSISILYYIFLMLYSLVYQRIASRF